MNLDKDFIASLNDHYGVPLPMLCGHHILRVLLACIGSGTVAESWWLPRVWDCALLQGEAFLVKFYLACLKFVVIEEQKEGFLEPEDAVHLVKHCVQYATDEYQDKISELLNMADQIQLSTNQWDCLMAENGTELNENESSETSNQHCTPTEERGELKNSSEMPNQKCIPNCILG